MCLGVPGQIVTLEPASDDGPWGSVSFDGVNMRVCLACVPDAQPGDFVLVHAGLALHTIDEAEARRVLELLQAMNADEANALP